jgi:hypothetical protein
MATSPAEREGIFQVPSARVNKASANRTGRRMAMAKKKKKKKKKT